MYIIHVIQYSDGAQVANDQQHLDVERLDFGRAQGRKDDKTLFI
jgi:hypothetical protein